MIIVALITLTIVCAIGWLARYVSCTAMIYYLHMKGYKLPNDEEMKECTQYVVRHLIKGDRAEL